MKKVLVAYASKYHATAEIAATIAEILQGAYDVVVDVRSAETVLNVNDYDAVVLGSAVYAGSWLKGAQKFLEQFESLLAQRLVWLFSSGPTGEGDPVKLLDGWTFPEALRPVADRIAPRDIILFHGYINVERLNFAENLIIKALHAKTGDFRQWNVIHDWANSIGLQLQAESPVKM